MTHIPLRNKLAATFILCAKNPLRPAKNRK
jgi:hypothetical protein